MEKMLSQILETVNSLDINLNERMDKLNSRMDKLEQNQEHMQQQLLALSHKVDVIFEQATGKTKEVISRHETDIALLKKAVTR